MCIRDRPLFRAGPEIPQWQRVLAVHLRNQGRDGGRQGLLRRVEADHTARQHRRREIARLPSGLDHPSPDVPRTAAAGRRSAGYHPAFDRHRALRRHHRGYRPGAGAGLRAASAARGRGIDRPRPGMTVLLEKRRLIVSPGLAPAQLREQDKFGRPQHADVDLTIGLVNNMPDAALQATERQFMRLLRHAAGDIRIDLHCFSLPSVHRSQTAKWRVDRQYTDIADLGRLHFDGLIVTGAEPNAASLPEEPFWQDLTNLIDWAQTNTRSTIWSCLAAHAAVLHLDGIERQRLDTKCSGIYDCARVADHWLMRDLSLIHISEPTRLGMISY